MVQRQRQDLLNLGGRNCWWNDRQNVWEMPSLSCCSNDYLVSPAELVDISVVVVCLFLIEVSFVVCFLLFLLLFLRRAYKAW